MIEELRRLRINKKVTKRTIKGIGKISCEINSVEKKFSNDVGQSMDEVVIKIKFNKSLLWQPHSYQGEEFIEGIAEVVAISLDEYEIAQLSN